jgi:two-component system OmpR family sensor kinase
VVANLVANAIEHTPPATPVELRVVPNTEPPLIQVIDHGPGMDPGTTEQAFERFFRWRPIPFTQQVWNWRRPVDRGAMTIE